MLRKMTVVAVVVAIAVSASSCMFSEREGTTDEMADLERFASGYLQCLSDGEYGGYTNFVYPSCLEYYQNHAPSFIHEWFEDFRDDHASELHDCSSANLAAEVFPLSKWDAIEVRLMSARYGIQDVRKLYWYCKIGPSRSLAFAHYVTKDVTRNSWSVLFPAYTVEELVDPEPRRTDASIQTAMELQRWAASQRKKPISADAKDGRGAAFESEWPSRRGR